MNTVLDAARAYVATGLKVVPIPHGKKAPTLKKWEALDLAEADLTQHFNGRGNIGVLLAASGLVDVDLDVPEAAHLAAILLPQTRTFGRASKPRSHAIYSVAERRQTARYQLRLNGEPVTIAEYRDRSSKETTVQTVFPPSTHPSGEGIAWDGVAGEPFAAADADELFRIVRYLSGCAALLMLYPRSEGGRHDVAGALASVFARSGVAEHTAELVHAFAVFTGDDDPDDRARFAEDTVKALQAGASTTGAPKLREMLASTPEAAKAFGKALEWIDFEGRPVPTYSSRPPEPAPGERRGSAPPNADPSRFKLTDIGNAERFVDQHGDDLRYIHVQERFIVWDGSRYAPDETAEAYRRAVATVKGLYAEASAADDSALRKALAAHATRSEQTNRITAMVKAATWLDGVAVHTDDLDANPMLLNVQNGTVDLETGRLLPHTRANLITKLAPVTYDPAATCPTWTAFMDRIMGADDELISYLRRLTGYSLTGLTGEQMMAIPYGSGANGKSTMLETIAAILGDYAQQTPTDTLTPTRQQGVPNDVARLRGARFVSAVETGEGNRLAESLVKQMTGGDRITARFLRQEFFEFTPSFKLFLATNHKPVIRGTDEAIWRRIHLIPFKVTIPEGERDPRLKQKLAAEASGILNWALAGCAEWQRDGLQPPPAVLAATQEYRDEMDVLAAFLEDRCLETTGAEVKSGEIYHAYKVWCEANGEYAITNKAFSIRLMERGFEKRKKASGMHFIGLGLLADDSRQARSPFRD